jgi:serine/threonine protein kinase
MREKVFISYSHKDERWRQKFEKALTSGYYAKCFDVWSDKGINTGDDWEAKIEAEIARTRIALLLVSTAFLESDYIANKEAEAFLQSHAAGGLTIWWVPISVIPAGVLCKTNLDRIQAAWDPQKPLSRFRGKALDSAIEHIRDKLVQGLGLLRDTSSATRDAHMEAVSRAVGPNTKIIKAIALGDFSIIYQARRRDSDVVVKALVPSKHREWLTADFIQRANLVRKVNHASAIDIEEVIADEHAPCVIMEAAIGTRVRHGQQIPSRQVASILAQLATLAGDFHRLEGGPVVGPLRPRHLFIDEFGKVRISLVHISNETLPSCRQRPMLLLDDDELSNMSPERYAGETVGAESDQYHLGLLGLELLLGRHPTPVEKFSQLEAKRAFFEAPRERFGELRRENSALSFVLARMLAKDPRTRWASMSELAQSLADVASGRLPGALRKKALSEYKASIRNTPAFYRAFYEHLFRAHPTLRTMFPPSLEEQYRKLDQAIVHLFNFDPLDEITSLDSEIERHKALRLSPEHLDAFRDAFLKAISDLPNTDEESQDAWHAILDPALGYMRQRVVEDGKVQARRGHNGPAAGVSP